MSVPVFLTVDTELMWRHHAARLPTEALFARSIEPAGVGISYKLAVLKRFGLKACFFVDPMPALVFGLGHIRRIVETILAAGQEVQLHLHPNWSGAAADDGGARYSRFQMVEYSLADQSDLIAGAIDLLMAAGAPRPVAFRAGSYAANDDTLRALVQHGIAYDSSHNGSEHPWPSQIYLPIRQISPVARLGLVEVPVTLIEERPGHLRNFQICALSLGEMRAALDHAHDRDHAAVTIVTHGFELANRSGVAPNAVHVRRFDGLCAELAERAGTMPTQHFANMPVLRTGHSDTPLSPDPLRTRWRQAEQLWSNLVAERVG